MRGMLLMLTQRRLLLLPQQFVLGYAAGWIISRMLPPQLALPSSPCRFCAFSWEAVDARSWQLSCRAICAMSYHFIIWKIAGESQEMAEIARYRPAKVGSGALKPSGSS